MLGLGLVAATGVTNAGALCDAVEAFFARAASTPRRITWTTRRPMTRVYTPAKLRSLAEDPTVRALSVWLDDADRHPSLRLHMRDAPGSEDYERRWSGASVPDDCGPTPLLELVRSLTACMTVVSGGLARYRDARHAQMEACGGGAKEDIEPVAYARISTDEMTWRRSRTKLRRLYPMTIIGPAIWRGLPPMPAFTPAPTIEDLGDCKLLTAWPTLCDPRDPAFLRANRDLRAWLWPHTIENPADHVDKDPAG